VFFRLKSQLPVVFVFQEVLKMKNRGLLLGFVGIMLLGACNNPFNTPEIPPENQVSKTGFGRVTILIAGEEAERTILPPTDFDHYKYTFTKDGETGGEEKEPDNNTKDTFTLEVGNYTVKVEAYMGTAGSYTLVASGESDKFTVPVSGNSDPVTVKLTLDTESTEKGKFTYTITYPADAKVEISLKKWSDNSSITVNGTTTDDTNNNNKKTTETLADLAAGSYLLTVKVTKGKDGYRKAGYVAAVHIYPLLTTTYDKTFTENDLLPNTVILATNSKGDAGNEEITNLDSNKYYYVLEGKTDKVIRYVKADGKLTEGTEDLGKIGKLTGTTTKITGLKNGETYEVKEATPFSVGDEVGKISKKIQYWDYKDKPDPDPDSDSNSFSNGTLSLPTIDNDDIEQFYGIDLGLDTDTTWEIMKFSDITDVIAKWDTWTDSRCSGTFDKDEADKGEASPFNSDIFGKTVGIYQYPDDDTLKPYYAPDWIAGTSHIYVPVTEGTTDFLIIERDKTTKNPTGDLYLFTVEVNPEP